MCAAGSRLIFWVKHVTHASSARGFEPLIHLNMLTARHLESTHTHTAESSMGTARILRISHLRSAAAIIPLTSGKCPQSAVVSEGVPPRRPLWPARRRTWARSATPKDTRRKWPRRKTPKTSPEGPNRGPRQEGATKPRRTGRMPFSHSIYRVWGWGWFSGGLSGGA